jgi:hypothetical protein
MNCSEKNLEKFLFFFEKSQIFSLFTSGSLRNVYFEFAKQTRQHDAAPSGGLRLRGKIENKIWNYGEEVLHLQAQIMHTENENLRNHR